MPTRAAFWQEPTPRIRLVSTPKPSSWLNQGEICGSILVPRLLQWASFPAVTELRQRLFASIESVNTTLAKPFNWTDMGRPLAAETSIELAPSCTSTVYAHKVACLAYQHLIRSCLRIGS